jgi:outer membrane protein TolC
MTSARAAQKSTLLLLISSALVLQACAPGADVSPSQTPTPTEQINAGQTIANAPIWSGVPASYWWHMFGDTQLDRLVDEARKGVKSLPNVTPVTRPIMTPL